MLFPYCLYKMGKKLVSWASSFQVVLNKDFTLVCKIIILFTYYSYSKELSQYYLNQLLLYNQMMLTYLWCLLVATINKVVGNLCR